MSESKYSNYCEQLYNAMKGAGTDEDTLIKVTTSEPLKERLKIKDKYIVMYGRDLLDDLKSDLSGNFGKVMLALYTDKYEYDAEQIYTAIKGLGTDEDTLIEIIASRPGWMLKKIKDAYKRLYEKDLEEDVKKDTSGNFQKLLITLIQCNRSQNTDADVQKCIQICDELYNAGEKKLGTDEYIFNKYIGNCSPVELMTVCREYHRKYGKTLIQVIDSEFSGNIKKIIKHVLYANICPSEYFAMRINEAVKGLGTNEKILNRVIVTRNEIDMPIIKKYYKNLYGKDMVDDIKDDVSGDYKKLLVALINK
jgi:hypothetical protein